LRSHLTGVPLMMSAYSRGSSYLLRVAGYALEAIAGVPVARALLRRAGLWCRA
jgi:hypothetical protein